MFFVFLVGPAGSGKSSLTGALADWMLDHDVDVATVNLDPGADWLPYRPDVDVRDYVTVEDVMERYNLGPNGAIIAAADLAAVEAEKIRDEIQGLKADYVLIDTPGQLELFAFRASGLHLASTITKGGGSAILFLVDVVFAKSPSSLISALLLASSVHYRFMLPQLLLLTKCDLVDRTSVDYLLHLIENPSELAEAALRESRGLHRELNVKLCNILSEFVEMMPVLAVSATQGHGLDNLYATLQRIAAGGEDYVVHY